MSPTHVAPYELFEAMDPAGSGEIDIAALMQSYWDVEYRGASRDSSDRETMTSENGMSSGNLRRSHRIAAVLAFRNARYDDAIVNAKQALRGTAGAVDSPEAALVELLLLSRAYAASNQHDLGAGFVNSLTIAVGGPWDDFF
ncbi:hypothetical protein Pmar_PMAR002405 [Perkinsus marinus ATCC 50983]|uniref:Uncharacterized protein n=1 Tax=Perkinsus marinus (strain ATCC 50983 / TXsc) TaxID=423536 RepID=C5LYV2_PERM5|nr:hypothetical protein Pmar_PMAR002405 [Perkinsus marinus ATCC 50983]EEQ98126.1 hypothetical protein Pmar_PMAR002405 [Perkinsus marinus ATCC 50983]|eukprot:XP_002765409.1 hypothetical protein Pmar_PMAR002405 [Perkinsus marinus ATCC 50983]